MTRKMRVCSVISVAMSVFSLTVAIAAMSVTTILRSEIRDTELSG